MVSEISADRSGNGPGSQPPVSPPESDRNAPGSRPRRAPVDVRLWRRVALVRVWLASSVAVGLGLTGCLVAQAVFLGNLLARLFSRPADVHDVLVDIVGLGAATLVRSVLLWASSTAGAVAANRVRGQLRRDALRAVLERGSVWLAGERTGELAVTLGRGLDALDAYVADYLPRVVLAAFSPLVLLAVIGFMDWLSMVIVLAALGAVPLLMVLVGKLTEQRVAQRWAALATLGAHFLDTVEGLPVLRAYGRARRQETQIATVTDDLRRTTLAVLRQAFLSALVLETLAAVGTALVAVPLALRLLGGHMTLAPALTVLILTPEVFLPLRRASADFHAATEGLSAWDRVFEVLGTDTEDPVEPHGAPVGGERGAAPGRPGGGLGVTGLRVRYPDRQRCALEGVEVAVAAGQRVAVVGPSGAGKSSLLGALLGLVPISAGSITFEGLSQHDVDPERWRTWFAYLPQRPRLFSASLRDNLRLGLPPAPDDADDDQLAEALSVAQLTELVARLPDGLSTPLGEGGGRLSAGERQRVGLARALCRPEARVVILDEPTAHLDASTEAQVVAGLDRWLAGRSLIVASHRPRLLELADRIVTLDGGLMATDLHAVAEARRPTGPGAAGRREQAVP